MRFLGAYVPVYAKVRKYRKYEYRYVEDMGELTFSNENPSQAGQSRPELDALSYEHLSKQNYIEFYDHKDKKNKRAWFSGFGPGTTNHGSLEYGSRSSDFLKNKAQWA